MAPTGAHHPREHPPADSQQSDASQRTDEAAFPHLLKSLLAPPDALPTLSVCGRKEKLYRRISDIAIEYKELETRYSTLSDQTRQNLFRLAKERMYAAAILTSGTSTTSITGCKDALQDQSRNNSLQYAPVAERWWCNIKAILRTISNIENLSESKYRELFALMNEEELKAQHVHQMLSRIIGHSAPRTRTVLVDFHKVWRYAYELIVKGYQLEKAVALAVCSARCKRGIPEPDETIPEWTTIEVTEPVWLTVTSTIGPIDCLTDRELTDDDPDVMVLTQTLGNLSLAAYRDPLEAVSSPSNALVLLVKKKASSTKPLDADSPTTPATKENKANLPHQKTRTEQSASQHAPPPKEQTKHQESAAVQKLNTYNKQWASLGPKDVDYPFPNPDLTRRGFLNVDNLECESDISGLWGVGTRIIVNTKAFFLAGFDLEYNVEPTDDKEPELDWIFTLTDANKVEDVKKLIRHLKLKEFARWHPDRLNKRTGMAGGVDAGKGKIPAVVEIRTALQELLEECESYVDEMETAEREAIEKENMKKKEDEKREQTRKEHMAGGKTWNMEWKVKGNWNGQKGKGNWNGKGKGKW